MRPLSLSLRLGAVYDWVFAGAILLAPPALMTALKLPPPADLFLFKLTALPLLFFPLVYWSAAADPLARSWAVRIALSFRLAGGLFLGGLALVMRPPGVHLYLTTALLDLAWGATHWALWRHALAAAPPAGTFEEART